MDSELDFQKQFFQFHLCCSVVFDQIFLRSSQLFLAHWLPISVYFRVEILLQRTRINVMYYARC